MIHTIEELGEISVARGCGLAALAIGTFMVGLSWDMVLAAKVGGGFSFFSSARSCSSGPRGRSAAQWKRPSSG
jgi:hypothetical protein